MVLGLPVMLSPGGVLGAVAHFLSCCLCHFCSLLHLLVLVMQCILHRPMQWADDVAIHTLGTLEQPAYQGISPLKGNGGPTASVKTPMQCAANNRCPAHFRASLPGSLSILLANLVRNPLAWKRQVSCLVLVVALVSKRKG